MDEIILPFEQAKDRIKIRNYLKNLDFAAALPDIYWLPVPQSFLTSLQLEHLADCGPYVLALEATEKGFILETLVRATNQLHCNCMEPASNELRLHMERYIKSIVPGANECRKGV